MIVEIHPEQDILLTLRTTLERFASLLANFAAIAAPAIKMSEAAINKTAVLLVKKILLSIFNSFDLS